MCFNNKRNLNILKTNITQYIANSNFHIMLLCRLCWCVHTLPPASD
ncbi:hypothetical protein [Escherichia phage BI-EHEC]|nr:hypothetical protein [Escherichia phage BI-EHEC]